MRTAVLAWLWLVAAAASPGLARAAGHVIRPFPADRLAALAPMLRHGEMAAIETDGTRPRQITLIGLAEAPPEICHGIVAHPELYPRFVRNVSESTVEARADGSVINTWQLELPIGHFSDQNELRFDAPAATGAIRVRGTKRDTSARWEFLPATGGGTVVVEYMDYDVPRDNAILARMLEKNPAFETGMQLAAGLVVMKSVLGEAARRARAAGAAVTAPTGGAGGGFGFLLERGAVAVIRSLPSGALLDVSVVQRVPASPEGLLGVVKSPERWPEFMPSLLACRVKERDAGGLTYEDTIEGVLINVETRYRLEFLPGGVDALGLAGDLKGARYRWDFTPTTGGVTTIVYRANFALREANAVMRLLLRYEPFFEHGVNVGVGVTAVQALARRVLALAVPHAEAHTGAHTEVQ